MKAQITIVDKNGRKRTWMFRPWSEMGGKFKHGDKIRVLLHSAKVIVGYFDRVEDSAAWIKEDVSAEAISYPLSSIMGFNKPKD